MALLHRRVTADGLRNAIGDLGAAMLVVGGMIGVGIFVNPAVVARSLPNPTLIVLVWIAGGALALVGAFIYAELAERMPSTGGDYVYLRETYGPLAAFLFGWTTLLVVQAGSMAAIAIVFARTVNMLTGGGLSEPWTVAATLAVLALINCAGVIPGNAVQLSLGLLKLAMFAGIVTAALSVAPLRIAIAQQVGFPTVLNEFKGGVGAAIVPVVFSYGGWQTANFVAGEIKDARARLSRSLIWGVCIVIVIYVSINLAYLHVLGAAALGASSDPLAGVFKRAFGPLGALYAAAAVGLSAIAFLSQSMLTGPRVYFAMARDGLLPKPLSKVATFSGAPVTAVLLQAAWAEALAFSNSYEHLLHYVVSINFLFFAISASSLFILRRRDRERESPAQQMRFSTPLHPCSTLLFMAACVCIVGMSIVTDPLNSAIGYGIILVGLPIFFYQKRIRPTRDGR
jgi:APA family basic amino acid/polyamine antiporter